MVPGSRSPKAQDAWATLLDDGTVRKIVRKVLSDRTGTGAGALQKICSEPTLSQHLARLADLGVLITEKDGRCRPAQTVDNFGRTFEWYVAWVMSEEFEAESEWAVRIRGLTVGDFDVIALLERDLVHIECKSAAPESIGDRELRMFLQAAQDLAPDIAIFLVDTDNELECLVDRFNIILADVAVATIEPQGQGIFFGCRRVYVINSKPSVRTQIRRCLRHFNTKVRGATFLTGEPRDFISGTIAIPALVCHVEGLRVVGGRSGLMVDLWVENASANADYVSEFRFRLLEPVQADASQSEVRQHGQPVLLNLPLNVGARSVSERLDVIVLFPVELPGLEGTFRAQVSAIGRGGVVEGWSDFSGDYAFNQ